MRKTGVYLVAQRLAMVELVKPPGAGNSDVLRPNHRMNQLRSHKDGLPTIRPRGGILDRDPTQPLTSERFVSFGVSVALEADLLDAYRRLTREDIRARSFVPHFKPSFFPAASRAIDSRMRLSRVSGRLAE